MNKALLAQLGLAKEAGTKAMAKDFFAKPPSPGTEPGAEPGVEPGLEPCAEGGVQTSAADAAEGEGMPPGLEGVTPEQLQELLAMLEAQGQG